MTQLLNAALAYAECGWHVFPLKDKRHPLIDWKPLQVSLPQAEQIRLWWEQNPQAWIGCALGNGLCRVDCEGPVPDRWLSLLAPTLEFKSPNGRGYLYAAPDGLRGAKLWQGDGDHQEFRVQAAGAYTVLPPSPGYEWTNKNAIAPLPAELVVALEERRISAESNLPHVVPPSRERVEELMQFIACDPDDRDVWLMQIGFALHSAGDEYFEVWDTWSRSSSKYAEGECAKLWSAMRRDGRVTVATLYYYARKGGWRGKCDYEPLTEGGFANALARYAADRIAHSVEWGWLAFSGTRWRVSGHAEKLVQELQKELIAIRYKAAVDSLHRLLLGNRDAPDFEKRMRGKVSTMKAIRRHDDMIRIAGARKLAESVPSISADYRDYNAKPLLFNCANGTLDLSSTVLQPHCASDRLTQLCPHAFAEAPCPVWQAFLASSLPDADVREFLRLFLGSCLTGDVAPQMMPIFYGAGENGKSTLVETLLYVLGDDYSMKANRGLLMSARNSDGERTKARLLGKRFVACVESEEGGRLNETNVKELTGGDTIAARMLFHEEFEFAPTHKLVLITNHKPDVRGTDHAIWRRLPLVEFGQQFRRGDSRRVENLGEKLRAEASGILWWLAQACREWLASEKAIKLPAAVVAATEEYRFSQDHLAQFIADKCTVAPELKVSVGELVRVYQQWCGENGIRYPLTNRKLGDALRERGFAYVDAATRKERAGIDVKK